MPSIADLTRRMSAGDEAAYHEFYDAYFDRLSRYLLVVTHGDEQAMREALQGAMVRVARHVRVFHSEPEFWSWLTVLARSAHLDDHRKRRRYLAFLDRFTRHSRTVEDPGQTPSDDRLPALLQQGVARLDPDDRQLLEWKYTERRPASDIARGLNTTEKAVESRLARLRQKIKDTVLTALKHESSL